MKTLQLSALLFASAVATTASAAPKAAPWNLDAAHSDVSFKVRHLAVSSVRGSFRAVSGTLQLDPSKLGAAKVDIEIDAKSIDTHNDKRDEHLRSADFFDVAKHPKLHFVSTRVRRAGTGLRIDGNLTLHGVTKKVTLRVPELGASVVGPYGFERRGFTATAKIDRRDFGLTWSKSLETGGLVVGHEVEITIEAEFMRKAKGAGA